MMRKAAHDRSREPSMRSVRARLLQWGVHPRKRYGQHFLTSRTILERIAETAELSSQDTAIEIGAGLGDLTALMASKVKQVVALELDRNLSARLQKRFEAVPSVHVIHQDALHWPLPDALKVYARPRKILGNLPYNVATRILMRFSRFPREIDRMVLMLQKEVAERLVAKVGTRAYGGITLLLQLDWEASIAFKVRPNAFHPRPNVESAVVVLCPLVKPRVDIGDRGLFRQLVKAAFGHRRKTLKNALKDLRPNEPGWSETLLMRAGIEGTRRGETLSLQEYAHLTKVALEFI